MSIAVWNVSQVLVPPITTAATLTSPATRGLREMIDAAPADFFGSAADSVNDLLRHRTIAANIHRGLLAESDPRRLRHLRHHLHRARANVARTDPKSGQLDDCRLARLDVPGHETVIEFSRPCRRRKPVAADHPAWPSPALAG